MGRKLIYANDSQKTKAYRFNKKGIVYEIIDGFVHEKTKKVGVVKLDTPPRERTSVSKIDTQAGEKLSISDIIGIMIQKQKLLVNLYRNRGTHRKALDALYELELEILKILAE